MGRGEAAAVAAAPSLASASSDAPLLQYELATILSPERGFVDRGILAETQEHRRRVKGSSIVEAVSPNVGYRRRISDPNATDERLSGPRVLQNLDHSGLV